MEGHPTRRFPAQRIASSECPGLVDDSDGGRSIAPAEWPRARRSLRWGPVERSTGAVLGSSIDPLTVGSGCVRGVVTRRGHPALYARIHTQRAARRPFERVPAISERATNGFGTDSRVPEPPGRPVQHEFGDGEHAGAGFRRDSGEQNPWHLPWDGSSPRPNPGATAQTDNSVPPNPAEIGFWSIPLYGMTPSSRVPETTARQKSGETLGRQNPTAEPEGPRAGPPGTRTRCRTPGTGPGPGAELRPSPSPRGPRPVPFAKC